MQNASRPSEELATALKRIEPGENPVTEQHTGRKKRRQRGIRSRVMGYQIGFVVFLIALLWLFQIAGLDGFYRWDKNRQLKSAATLLAQNISSGELKELVEYIAVRYDCCVILQDEWGRIVCQSEYDQDCLIHSMSPKDRAYWCGIAPKDGKVLTERFQQHRMEVATYSFGFIKGRVPEFFRDDREALLGVKRIAMPDGSAAFLFINTVITPVDSTVETLQTQLILVTGVLLIAAMLLAGMISRRVTQPIIRVNEAARELSWGRYSPPEERRSYREIEELNDTLTEAARELSQVERLQHELIANISHDLRTPLTMIGGYAEVMRDIPGEASAENLQIVIDETNRLTSLVSELLDFSRLQTGHTAMEDADFDLTRAITEIVQRVAVLTGADGYTVNFAPDAQVFVHADEKRIGQVVYNLVGNALTYTGEDKTVTITQTVAEGSVRIAVSDTGKGIAPEELPRIWNRYYRAQESHKRAVIGSGLGLSIVQGILEKHGARYGVDSLRAEESAKDHGTTFWFELPTVPAPEKMPENPET